jgi:3-methyladenine DNA glycosylase/8-oxoguanine DNA glycosylase
VSGPHGAAFSGRVGWGTTPALVVIDLVRAYTDPAGPFGLPDPGPAVAATEALVEAARAHGRPVVWTVVVDDAPSLPDEEVIERLVSVRGIGRWTAEMYLMFELRRPDVWPVDDLGVRQGYGLVFGVDPPPPARRLGPLGDRFRPYRSVAARYMWEAVALHRADARTELR